VKQTPPAGRDETLERLTGIVERVTFHNEQNGWSVLKVTSFRDPSRLATVLIHQVKVYAGATMEFWGTWGQHPKFGPQFKAVRAVEQKPATAAALEKYLGSGLIRGVGPVTAKKIVGHFREDTLEVFESRIEELMQVPGIADRKLAQIKESWATHRTIRDVMIFLQGYGISTLFATKIYKTYGDAAIQIVSANPYRLAHDIYGIGFFSADAVALAMGFARTGEPRIEAGIKQVLAASREEGHCFLTEQQIVTETVALLREAIEPDRLLAVLHSLLATDQVKCRHLIRTGDTQACYYSKGLYFDELTTAYHVKRLLASPVSVDTGRVRTWVTSHCEQHHLTLSDEQQAAVCGIAGASFSILTGGPGCGKTTTTKVLVQLLKAMRKHILLAAPTGRAAQRMTEVIGGDAKTIHRLLEWAPTTQHGFKRDEQHPLKTDFLIVDETSMLDISLAASLLQAVPRGAQVLFIGDPDQLPAVGAGDVVADLLRSTAVPRYRLTQVFRQAQASSIIRFAHEINTGTVPRILSPLARPGAFAEGHDCLFVDADEATQEQIKFLQRARTAIAHTLNAPEGSLLKQGEAWVGRLHKTTEGIEVDALYRPEHVDAEAVRAPVLIIPERFKHVDLTQVAKAESGVASLMAVLKSVHPWSALHYGLTAVETVVRLYTKTIPEWLGPQVEIQVLTPQVRGTLGTLNLNASLQQICNPQAPHTAQLQIGERILRVGDRVIQTRNNYDLGVFNGDIGRVTAVDPEEMTVAVRFASGEERTVHFERDALSELALAYAITIHKSQGSEFQVVIIPVLSQHFNMLFRNLIYTALTRAKQLAIFVGSRKAFAMAVGQIDNRKRQTALTELVGAQ
jgi:exodeoxyribonuclease V alpha subunit